MSNTWKSVASIKLEDGRLILSGEVTTDPGLYRLRFKSGAVYVGEASNLLRRVCDYLKYYDSVGIESEYRLNKRLNSEGGAEVEVRLGPEFEMKSVRCTVEHQEIKQLRNTLDSSLVLNGGTLVDRIDFYKAEIDRLEKKLHRLNGQDLDEVMHKELLQNVEANAISDEMAREQAREMGFSEPEIDKLISRKA